MFPSFLVLSTLLVTSECVHFCLVVYDVSGFLALVACSGKCKISILFARSHLVLVTIFGDFLKGAADLKLVVSVAVNDCDDSTLQCEFFSAAALSRFRLWVGLAGGWQSAGFLAPMPFCTYLRFQLRTKTRRKLSTLVVLRTEVVPQEPKGRQCGFLCFFNCGIFCAGHCEWVWVAINSTLQVSGYGTWQQP